MGSDGFIEGRATWLLKKLGKRIWVRAVAFSLFAVATALLSAFVSPYLSVSVPLKVAGKAVSDLLNILATSMLAVTSFSLSIMVNAFAAASQSTTPRATHLLVTDSVATTTLATFVGSFLYSIVGIIGLAAGLYGEQGRVILLFATVVVVAMVAAALLRWIDELGYFGRVDSTLARVETKTVEAARNWGRTPRLGCAPPEPPPSSAAPLYLLEVGHVQFIDVGHLQEIAERHEAHIHLRRKPGSFVAPTEPVAHVTCALDEETTRKLRACFHVANERNFEQDPHYGLAVLSEIASKALSPGINDPGTAIRAVQSGLRGLLAFGEGRRKRREVLFARVSLDDLDPHELVDEFVNPIARDGLAQVEVQIIIQRALHILSDSAPGQWGGAVRRVATETQQRTQQAPYTPHERDRLERASAWIALSSDQSAQEPRHVGD